MEAYLSCEIHVVLLPRISNTDAIIAVSLSKRSNTRDSDLKYISHKAFHVCHTLAEWLQQPSTDWHLGTEIVNFSDNNSK
jgi:hypothetical protein